MGRKEIELEAERLLEPALKQLGIELIDVEYVREFSVCLLTKRAVLI